MLSVVQTDGVSVVTVAPISHSPPVSPHEAVEIPAATKQRLGMDNSRSWVVLTEINRFQWPGADLRPIPTRDGSAYHYGILPLGLFRKIRDGILACARNDKIRATPP